MAEEKMLGLDDLSGVVGGVNKYNDDESSSLPVEGVSIDLPVYPSAPKRCRGCGSSDVSKIKVKLLKKGNKIEPGYKCNKCGSRWQVATEK
ncbi:MAG: hypothetical protein K6F99_07955 [Lachnospiraceae bacterium]|nr:hypothetical protein [Lachnospiraceae bacterium]